jgi:hypothetical protein
VCPDQQEHYEHNDKRYRQPNKMFGILEFTHVHPSQSVSHPPSL